MHRALAGHTQSTVHAGAPSNLAMQMLPQGPDFQPCRHWAAMKVHSRTPAGSVEPTLRPPQVRKAIMENRVTPKDVKLPGLNLEESVLEIEVLLPPTISIPLSA